MSNPDPNDNSEFLRNLAPRTQIIMAEWVPEPPAQYPPVAPPARRRVWLPLGLFVATCLSTLLAGSAEFGLSHLQELGPAEGLKLALLEGLKYALPVMTILVFHEMGHFLQARRYGVYASYPFFIPMPISPLGTFGAVIAMDARMGDRKALFDIGISGPLAGLVPTLVFCVVGLKLSKVVPAPEVPGGLTIGAPLLFQQISAWVLEPLQRGYVVDLHPMAFAGWVGLLITAINLIPVGQLDGGHVLYALLRTKAHRVATLLLLGAVAGVIMFGLYGWTLMLVLLMFMGPIHPPTANDNVPLGRWRILLGWLTLSFIVIGFTPTPIVAFN